MRFLEVKFETALPKSDAELLGDLLTTIICTASNGITLQMNRAYTIDLAPTVTQDDLDRRTIALLKPKFGKLDFPEWDPSQLAAAFYLQAVLRVCPKLMNQLTEGNAELLVVTDEYVPETRVTYAFIMDLNWPDDDHPLKLATDEH